MGLCMAAQKGPFVMKHYVVLSPTAPEDPSVLRQGRGQTERLRREIKRVERKIIRREKKDETAEYKGETLKMRETLSYAMLTVVKVQKSKNRIETKCSVLIFPHKMFSLSYVVKQKSPLNVGLGVIKISLQLHNGF